MRKQFILNPSQERLTQIITHDPIVENVLAYGPARSGKTASLSANVAHRAFIYPGTTHGIFRRTRRAAIFHLFKGTFPEVMEMLYPGYLSHPAVKTNTQDGTITFHNGSKIVFDGIDPNDIERILGPQYATAWINECNELEDYVLDDGSVQGLSSERWAEEVIRLYDHWKADEVVAEKNYGGDMVAGVIRSARRNIEPTLVTASRGKIVRAGPVAAQYRAKKVIHMGSFKELEAQMCDYREGTKKSPDRMDALVWALTHLLDLNGDANETPRGMWTMKSNKLPW